MKVEVFISYAWENESEKIVQELSSALTKKKFNVIMDKTHIGYKDNIKEFMKNIGKGRFVIVVISDKYLKSENCMFEMLEIIHNGDVWNRIIPIVLESAKIIKEFERIDYFNYWEGKIKELEKAHGKIKNHFGIENIAVKTSQYYDIRRAFDGITDMLRNMNTLTPSIHQELNYSTIKDYINNQLKKDIDDNTVTSVAFQQISDEVFDNFNKLSVTIWGISNMECTILLTDIRKVNETEFSYQQRLKESYHTYVDYIRQCNSQIDFNDVAYKSFYREIAYDPRNSSIFKVTYEDFKKTLFNLTQYEKNILKLLTNSTSNLERIKKTERLLNETIVNAKINLFYAASNFILTISGNTQIKRLSESLDFIYKEVNLNEDFLKQELCLRTGNEGRKELLKIVSGLYEKKKELLAGNISNENSDKKREIERRITDPYLKLLRKTIGLSEDLNRQEIIKDKLDMDEKEPEKLFQLAAISFLELDGQGAIFYYNRAIEIGSLSPTLLKFAKLSLHRLENPDIYCDSIGVMVFKITGNSGFNEANIQVGDVIIKVNEIIIQEPMDIANELGKRIKEPIMIEFIRDGDNKRIVVIGGQSAGAMLTPLVILNVVQL